MAITVLSLFNGMSTGYTALKNLGVDVKVFYSSEIKPAALRLTSHLYPEIIQLGDINNWRKWDLDWSSVDLILSGSPCKDLSIAGKRKGIYGSNSGLFWKFIEILDHTKRINSKVLFLQENVSSAPVSDVGVISRALGVYPARINSSLVTAQLRDRLYWSNIKTKQVGLFSEVVTDIPHPIDKNIFLKDVITDGWVSNPKAYCLLESESRCTTNQDSLKKRHLKAMANLVYVSNQEVCVKSNTKKGFDIMTENDCLNLSFPNSLTRRARVTKNKPPCLLEGDEPLFVLKDYKVRRLNKVELCRLQGFPDEHCDILTRNKAASLLGDGWTLPVIEHIFSFLPACWFLTKQC